MKLAWGRRLTPEQRKFVVAMARALGASPSDMTSVIAFESNWNPAAVNAISGATGLIQFMPRTAIGLGTTVEDLRGMTIDDQLRYCHAYWKPYAGRIGTLSDCYMAVLYPAAIGLPDEAVIFLPGSREYLNNRGLDINHDGAVTKAEATSFVAKRLAEGLLDANAIEIDDEAEASPQPEAEGATMGAGKLLDVATMITSIFNPLAGGVLGLAGQLVRDMAPAVQGKLAQEIGRHTDPTTAQTVATSIASTLVNGAQLLTGQTDPARAVAEVTANPANAEALQQLQAQLESDLDARAARVKSVGDASMPWDQAKWKAEGEGKQLVSNIAIAERLAGIWDMTPFLVKSLLIMLWGIAWGLLLAICGVSAAIIFDSTAAANANASMVLTALIGLAGPIWTGAIVASVAAIVAYRFDGSKQSSDQTRAALAVALEKNPSRGSAVPVA